MNKYRFKTCVVLIALAPILAIFVHDRFYKLESRSLQASIVDRFLGSAKNQKLKNSLGCQKHELSHILAHAEKLHFFEVSAMAKWTSPLLDNLSNSNSIEFYRIAIDQQTRYGMYREQLLLAIQDSIYVGYCIFESDARPDPSYEWFILASAAIDTNVPVGLINDQLFYIR